jgi:hypothetical protein
MEIRMPAVAHASRRTPRDGSRAWLTRCLGWIDRAADGEALSVLLGDLDGFLGHHFAAEEGPGGLYQELAGSSPSRASVAIELEGQHRAIREEIASLRAAIRPTADQVPGVLRRRVVALGSRIRAHEARERTLRDEAHDPRSKP